VTIPEPTADCRLPIADRRLPIADRQLPIADRQFKSSLHFATLIRRY
jgi:hypothetical protein